MLLLQFFAIALLGSLIHASLKLRSLQQKAKVGNAGAFNAWQYMKEDVFAHVAAFATILLALFFAADTLHHLTLLIGNDVRAMLIVKGIFAFVGYSGSDVASRLFGAASKRLNTIIDQKTNIADGK
jgi:hypothetical protein